MCVAVNLIGVRTLRRGHDQRGRPVDVGSGHGRQAAVGERHAGLLAGRQRPGHQPHQVVDALGVGVGRRLDVRADVVAAAVHVLEGLEDAVVHPADELVDLGDVVAVLGSLVAELPDLLVLALEVGRQGLLQLGHGQLLRVVDEVLHRHQPVGGVHATDGDLGDRVVVGPAVPDLGAGLDAAPGQDGAPGDRQVLGAQDARDPRLAAERVLAELELLLEGRVQLLEVLELLGIPGLGPDLLLGARVEAVVQVSSRTLPRLGWPSTGWPVS